MKRLGMSVGIIVVVVLLLLASRFNTYMQLQDEGYAVEGNEISKSLAIAPQSSNIDQVSVEVPLCSFGALENVYERAGRYYVGETKKVQINAGFAVYLDDGASIQLLNDQSVLLNQQFEQVETYQGMIITDGNCYNLDRSRADGDTYLFLGLNSGFFYNLRKVQFSTWKANFTINENSMICFNKQYIAYYEFENGVAKYTCVPSSLFKGKFQIEEQELTYEELLLKLGVLTPDKPKKVKETVEQSSPDETKEDIYTDIASDILDTSELTSKDSETDNPSNTDIVEGTTEDNKKVISNPQKSTKSGSGKHKGGSVNTNTNGPRGERPEGMRPATNSDSKTPVVGYVKPEVSIDGYAAGVYRILIDMTVSDPARRISNTKKVQFEFYEVTNSETNPDGTLAFRSFRGTTGTLEVGGGNVKPNTTYRIVSYVTYKDEYDRTVVEYLDEDRVTTGRYETLGQVVLKNQNIPYFYDSYLEVTNFGYNSSGTDVEAVAGIASKDGIMLIVRDYNTNAVIGTKALDQCLSVFKRGGESVVQSVNTLEANTRYKYELSAKDFFGNVIHITNFTPGEFYTSKARPRVIVTVPTNEIGNVDINIAITDVDGTMLEDEGVYHSMYMVLTNSPNEVTKQMLEQTGVTTFTSVTGLTVEQPIYADESVKYVYEITDAELAALHADGRITIDKILQYLDLGESYVAHVYGDYNLNNGAGDVLFDCVGERGFRAASLRNLGNIYMKSTVSNLSDSAADFTMELNTQKTVQIVKDLLRNRPIQGKLVVTGMVGDEEQVTEVTLTEEAIQHLFKDDPTIPALFNITGLTSMTDYVISLELEIEYNGKFYPMDAVLTTDAFKTLRQPPLVETENILLAGEKLAVSLRVTDPDETITGNGGHMVVVTLYQNDGTYIKGLRVPKNTEEFQELEFTNLNMSKGYYLTIVAVEYNRGYTNATFESNKLLKQVNIDSVVKLTGKIDLQNLLTISDTSKLSAEYKVSLSDENRILWNMPYYVDVACSDGRAITTIENKISDSGQFVSENDYIGNFQATSFQQVDRGNLTYEMTLYVYVNGRKLTLDTMTFTAEAPIKGFGSTYDMIKAIKDEQGKGRYIATEDIEYTYGLEYVNPNDATKKLTAGTICEYLQGQLDFAGHEFKVTKNNKASALFIRTSPDAEICNMDLKWTDEPTAVYSWIGGMVTINYGHIHDIYLTYNGMTNVDFNHQCYAVIARENASSGVIENFVVNHKPTEDRMPFMAYYEASFITVLNYGIVRNGYVYGENIVISNPNLRNDYYIAPIVSINYALGQVYNVFSLVDVEIPDNGSVTVANGYPRFYSSVVGYSSGSIHNLYGIGENPIISTTDGHIRYNDTQGPSIGYNVAARTENAYYYNADNKAYTKIPSQKMIGIDSIYNAGWHKELLGTQFDASPVEVGYYPQVKLSEELPPQDLIPLPSRASNGSTITISGTTVLEYGYDEALKTSCGNGDYAIIEVKLINNANRYITGFHIDNLDCEILNEYGEEMIDGVTTLRIRVSNPKAFVSIYNITEVSYTYGTSQRTRAFDPAVALYVDFYKNIGTADEWYKYVVQSPNSNARLTADIDFTGVDRIRICVTAQYQGKLDGMDHLNVIHRLKNINILSTGTNTSRTSVFWAGISGTSVIKNMIVENYTCGNTNVTQAGFIINSMQGTLDNVHVRNVDITGSGYLGGLCAQANDSSYIQNCSVKNVNIHYDEPDKLNTVGYLGGMVGYAVNSRITNNFVQHLDIACPEIRTLMGAGGLIGYSNSSYIENVYAEGKIEARGTSIGGVVGLFESGYAAIGFKNVFAKVDVITYQDVAGGLIGQTNINTGLYTTENVNVSGTNVATSDLNISGVAFGSIYNYNPDGKNISYTFGMNSGKKIVAYGSEDQLINGVYGVAPDRSNCKEVLSYEALLLPETYQNKIKMGAYYNYSMTPQGYCPKLYATDGVTLLYDQDNIKLNDAKEYDINITGVYLREQEGIIAIDFENPNGYEIVGVDVTDLTMLNNGDFSEPATSRGICYYSELLTNKKIDSYVINGIRLKVADSNGVMQDVTIHTSVSIPLTLYWDIDTVEKWNTLTLLHDSYENFRITADLNFGAYPANGYQYNTRIGRILGDNWTTDNDPYDGIVMKGINITGSMINFIYRLNSSLENVEFLDCSISTKDRDCVGFIGTSAAEISKVKFTNCTIKQNTNYKHYVGCIGYQNGGKLNNIKLTNVTVKRNSTGLAVSYVGTLAGGSQDSTVYSNIEGTELYADGNTFVGGLTGYCNRASYLNIDLHDKIFINANSSYCGGIIGYITNVSKITNVKLRSTKDYSSALKPIRTVASGKVIYENIGDQDVVINSGGSCVGGIFGEIGNDQISVSGVTAEGIVVLAAGDRRGGLAGNAGSTVMTNSYVKNSYIGDYNNTSPGVNHNYVGGLWGVCRGGSTLSATASNVNQDCAFENSVIDVTNCSYVGGIVGYKSEYVATYRDRVEDCIIKVTDIDPAKTYQRIGGIAGHATHQILSSEIMNTIIDAPDCDYVGGIAGYTVSDVFSCYYWGQNPVGSAASNLNYYIKGHDYVGGLIGYFQSGGLIESYSNANVIATGKGAGGLVGYYRTEYTNNGTNIVYSNASARLCYFAGRVHAEGGNAGGLIGINGMSGPYALTRGVTPSDMNIGIRMKGVSHNNAYEISFTCRNMMMAEAVTAKNGTAYAICGNNPYYLEKCNDGTAYTSIIASAPVYINNVALWEASKIGTGISNPMTGIWTDALLTDTTGTTRLYALMDGEKYQYKAWTDDTDKKGVAGYVFSNYHGTSYLTKTRAADHTTNVYTFSSSDIDNPKLWYNLGYTRYASGYYGVWPTGIKVSSTKAQYQTALNSSGVKSLLQVGGTDDAPYYYLNTSVGFYNLVLLKNNRYKAEIFTVPVTDWRYVTDNISILPYINYYTQTQSNNTIDYMVNMQRTRNICMTLPAYTATKNSGMFRTFAMNGAGGAFDDYYYADIYPSDVDKINVEFSDSLVTIPEQTEGYTYAYFILKSGGKIVTRQLIDKRVYTFDYGFLEDLELEVGYADIGSLDYYLEDAEESYINEELRKLGTTDRNYLVFADNYKEDLIWADEDLSLERGANLLRRKVMAYDNDYYYISEGLLNAGRGTTITGEAIHLLNGKVLLQDGSVYDVKTKVKEGTIVKTQLCENAKPLFTGRYENTFYETYGRFTEILSSEIVRREVQILSQGGMIGVIDGHLDNQKESAVMYKLSNKEYLTVLGNDGIMSDMYQGQNINAPEEFKNKGIMFMSNNAATSNPYILVQYVNGGVAGYNYATKEMLFAEGMANEGQVSLFSFVQSYFEGDRSILASVSDSYEPNYGLLSMTGTPSDLRGLLVAEAGEEIIADRTDALQALSKNNQSEDDTETIDSPSGSFAGNMMNGLSGVWDGSSMSDGKLANTDDSITGIPKDSIDNSTDTSKLNTAGEVTGSLNTSNTGLGTSEGDGALASEQHVPLKEVEGTATQTNELAGAESDAGGTSTVEGTSKESGESMANQPKEEKDEEQLVSTAGTVITNSQEGSLQTIVTTDGVPVVTMSKYQSTSSEGTQADSTDEDKDNEDDETDLDEESEDSKLIMIYNATTGTYELVSNTEYFTNQNYQSENHLYGITDLSQYNQCVIAKVEQPKADGLILYLIIATAVVGGVGTIAIIRHKRKKIIAK